MNLLEYTKISKLAEEPVVTRSGRMQIRFRWMTDSLEKYTWAEDFILKTISEWQARGYQPAVIRGEEFQRGVVECARRMFD